MSLLTELKIICRNFLQICRAYGAGCDFKIHFAEAPTWLIFIHADFLRMPTLHGLLSLAGAGAFVE